jgi:LacI family transcriptional regulator
MRVSAHPFTASGIIGDLRAILSADDLPSAICRWSDLHAINLLNMAKAMGMQVPNDLVIVGYNNSTVAAVP